MPEKLIGALHTSSLDRPNVDIDIDIHDDGSHFEDLNDILRAEIDAAPDGSSIILHLTVVP